MRSSGTASKALVRIRIGPTSFSSARTTSTCRCLSQLVLVRRILSPGERNAELVRKGRNYSLEDQGFVVQHQIDLIKRVLPTHAKAAKEGRIEISTSRCTIRFCPCSATPTKARVSTPRADTPAKPLSSSRRRSRTASAWPRPARDRFWYSARKVSGHPKAVFRNKCWALLPG
jgi:hypothetical protein